MKKVKSQKMELMAAATAVDPFATGSESLEN